MRGGVVAGGVALALLVGGCDTTDSRYFRYGIGTELYSEDIVQTTQLQDIYLTELCRQALPVLSNSQDSQCLNAVLRPNDWNLLVQAGLNDVDRRCDSYLAWLDDRRRTNNAVLKELGDVTVASQAIMRVAGVGANPITLAGLAFGLASNTFTNINSRLLLEVDKTTVQTLVLRRRNDYRTGLQLVSIENRPAAVHALRSYLNICTPFTIETDINSTIMVFQQAGAGALDRKGPLVNPATVANTGTPMRVQTATQVVERRDAGRVFKPVEVPLAQFFEETLSQTEAERSLNALCLNKNAVTENNKVDFSRALVRIYKNSGDADDPASVKITGREREKILKQTDCGPAQNYFERKNFANTINDQAKRLSTAGVVALVDFLNRAEAGGKIDPVTPLASARQKIKAVRIDQNVAKQLTIPVPVEFEGQVTPDLFAVLRNLPPK